MSRKADLKGLRFGKLTAIRRLNKKADKKGYFWLCSCDCGGHKEVTVSHLTGGSTKSCGCLVGRRRTSDNSNVAEIEDGFVEWLNEQMKAKSLTNASLSRQSGVSDLTIGVIRNRARTVSEESISKIKKALSEIPDFEFDTSLNGVPKKEVMDGRFIVFKNGVIYRRNKRGLIKKAPQNGVGRNRNYMMVTYSEYGEQYSYYVHRLVGEAFVSNPDEKPQINHKDGNPANNNAENLEWVTSKENVVHMYKTGLAKTLSDSNKKCLMCNSNPVLRTKKCSECKLRIDKLKSSLVKKLDNRKKYKSIDVGSLNDRCKRIINSRSRGATLEEVGKAEGITRERVRQIEKSVFEKEASTLNLPNRRTGQALLADDRIKGVSVSVKSARKIANLTQKEMAEKLGVSFYVYHKYEKNEECMRVNEAYKFSEVTGIPFKRILF